MGNEIDFIFCFRKAKSFWAWDDRFHYSYDGGQTWKDFSAYNDFDVMIKNQIGRYIVDHLIKPDIPRHLDLCYLCRNKGRVGVMRFNRITHGTESQAQVRYEEDVEIGEDVSFGVSYRIVKCDRCGHEDSDYA